MDDDAFRTAASAAIDDIIHYRTALEDMPVVSTVEPGYLRQRLPAAAPEQGESWEAIQKDLQTHIVPGVTHWQSPNFFAYFPCPSSYPSMLGEMYSATYAGAAFNWICSPAVTELETVVLDWLAQLLGLPDVFHSTGPSGGGGVIHGTASEAVLTAMTAAVDKYLRAVLPAGLSPQEEEDARAERRGRLVAIGSAATHSSTRKAAQVLGVRYRSVPVTTTNGRYHMSGANLMLTLFQIRAARLEPFFLTATLGTTDTCAIDDFEAITVALDTDNKMYHGGAGQKEVWVHIDAAFAGAALVLPEEQAAVAASGTAAWSRFHSFNTNMHKWMLTNFDCSCFFVRDRRWLQAALAADAHYYDNAFSAGGLVTDYRDWQLPLGRRFRSLKVWFVLRTFGANGLREYIRRSLALSHRFADALRARPDLFVIVTGPRYALTVFRCASVDDSADAIRRASDRTTRVCERINSSGKIWVTGTNLADCGPVIRFMTANYATQKHHIDAAAAIIIAAAEAQFEEEAEAIH